MSVGGARRRVPPSREQLAQPGLSCAHFPIPRRTRRRGRPAHVARERFALCGVGRAAFPDGDERFDGRDVAAQPPERGGELFGILICPIVERESPAGPVRAALLERREAGLSPASLRLVLVSLAALLFRRTTFIAAASRAAAAASAIFARPRCRIRHLRRFVQPLLFATRAARSSAIASARASLSRPGASPAPPAPAGPPAAQGLCSISGIRPSSARTAPGSPPPPLPLPGSAAEDHRPPCTPSPSPLLSSGSLPDYGRRRPRAQTCDGMLPGLFPRIAGAIVRRTAAAALAVRQPSAFIAPDRAEHRQGVRRARRDERAAFDAAARRRLVGGRCRRELQKQIPASGLRGVPGRFRRALPRWPRRPIPRFRVRRRSPPRRWPRWCLSWHQPRKGFMEGADDGRLLLRPPAQSGRRAGGAPGAVSDTSK